MPVSQSRLFICALLSTLSVTSWADSVLVNTTADEKDVNNSLCSLREAVAYLKDKTDKFKEIQGTSKIDNPDPTPDIPGTGIAGHRSEISTYVAANFKKEEDINKEASKPEAEQDKEKIKLLEAEIAANKVLIEKEQAAIKKLEDEMQAFRDAGKNGCVSQNSDSADVITLENSGAVYELGSEVVIKSSMTINDAGAAPTEDPTTLVTKTSQRSLIKAVGQHRLFRIDDGVPSDHDADIKTAEIRILVTFSNIDFQGCSQAVCANNGGLFYNADELSLLQCILNSGKASDLGGAVYNDTRTFFAAKEVAFLNNTASDGAAVYSEEVNLAISNSLFTDNTGANIIKTANKVAANSTSRQHFIISSTIGKNTGNAIFARESLILNNLTVVQNSGGINFNTDVFSVFNSIIAGNGQDCINFRVGTVADTAYFSNNVFINGCSTNANTNNYQISGTGTETLIADSNNDGLCDLPPAVGLLCPLGNYDGLTKTYKPRLLTSYNTLADSVIVNKGFLKAFSNIGVVCPASDQRGKARIDAANSRCDIGAVELQDITGSVPHQGLDIKFGQTATFDLLEKIGDAEIWPAALCQNIYGANASGYLDGCVRSVTRLVRGSLSFDGVNHTVTYRPNSSEFHGYEDFDYYLTTTISRFSDADNGKAMKVNVRVVSTPSSSLTSKSLDTGATGLFSLLVMGLLMVWRRIR